MSPKDYVAGLKRAKQRIIDELPAISEEIAVSTLSIVKDMAIEEGIIIDGVPGSHQSYSSKLINTSLFAGKELNKGGESYISANEKGNWAGFRKAQGLSDGNVNLAYTMRMWTGIQVLRTNQVGLGRMETIIGAADQETRDKIEANVNRYVGNFFDPTPEQKQMADEIAKERLNQIIQSET